MKRRAGTLLDILAAGRTRGAAIAIQAVDDRGLRSWSWQRLADAVELIADRLRVAGATGGTVALIGPNSPEWIAGYFAIIQAGAVAVPIDAAMGDADAAKLIAAAGCRICIASRDRGAGLRAGVPGTGFIAMEEAAAGSAAVAAGPQSVAAPSIGPDSEASFLFTSGTTGTPKIVPLTHRNLMHCVAAVLSQRIIEPGDCILLPLPLHHIYPFTVGLLSTLAGGGTVVFPEGLSGPQIIEALQKTRPQIMIGVPRLYNALVAAVEGRVAARGRFTQRAFTLLRYASELLRRLGVRGAGRVFFPALHAHFGSRLRTLACGGARLDEQTWRRLEEFGFEVLTGYGLTETAPLITFSPRGRARRGTEGVAIPGVELRIEPRPDAAFGEIFARGPNVFSGYRNNPEKTRAVFKDGWFRTGDLGALDKDGYLRVAGRADELIVLPDGKKVFPDRIERAYAACALIREIAILEHGGRLVAIVVPDLEAVRARGTARIRSLVNEEIEVIGAQLARYERVAGTVIISGSLPRTRLGKLRRHLLPEIYARAAEGAVSAAVAASPGLQPAPPELASPVERRLWEWLVRRFPDRKVALDSSLQLDFGIDSVDWINLTLELQQALGVRLTDRAMSTVITVRDLMVAVLAAQSAPATTEDEISDEERRWLEPRSPLFDVVAWCLHKLVRATMRLAFDLRAEGLERLPAAGPLIIAPNHLSYLDPFALIAVLPWRVLRDTYWAEWTGHMFAGPIQRLAARLAQAFPVDQDRGPAAGLALASELLGAKNVVVWFPEGQRSPSGELLPFTPGVGILVARTSAAVLPVRISGTYEALPRGGHRLRLSRVRIRIGAPADRAALEAEGEGDSVEARITEALQRRVEGLGGKKA